MGGDGSEGEGSEGTKRGGRPVGRLAARVKAAEQALVTLRARWQHELSISRALQVRWVSHLSSGRTLGRRRLGMVQLERVPGFRTATRQPRQCMQVHATTRASCQIAHQIAGGGAGSEQPSHVCQQQQQHQLRVPQPWVPQDLPQPHVGAGWLGKHLARGRCRSALEGSGVRLEQLLAGSRVPSVCPAHRAQLSAQSPAGRYPAGR